MNKPWVLITGASSGIGHSFSKIFAERGYNIILVARRKILLERLSEEIYRDYGAETLVIEVDLSKPNGVKEVVDTIKARNIFVEILVNNAGVGYCGEFHKIDIKNHNDTINLNILALTGLTRYLVEDMILNKRGKILNVASTGAYQPGPLISVYYATKAYVLSLSNALHNELKYHNITVTVLCPGTTATEFGKNAGKSDLSCAMSSEAVAKAGYVGLMKGKRMVVPGVMNKIAIFISNLVPASILAASVRKIQDNAMKK